MIASDTGYNNNSINMKYALNSIHTHVNTCVDLVKIINKQEESSLTNKNKDLVSFLIFEGVSQRSRILTSKLINWC